MTNAPGYTILNEDQGVIKKARLRLATALVVGELQRGPDTPDPNKPIQSFVRSTQRYGDRNLTTQTTVDWLEASFRRGLSRAFIIPLRGPAAVAASVTLAASSGIAFTATFADKGAEGNNWEIDVDVASGKYTLKISRLGVLKFTSPEFTTLAEGQAWAAGVTVKGQIILTPGAGGVPVATATPSSLVGGTDDFAGVTTPHIASVIARFTDAYGTGVLVLPGRTTLAVHQAMADHLLTVQDRDRTAKIELPETDKATLLGHAATLRQHDAADMLDMIVGREPVPGLSPATDGRLVPYTSLRMAREAANDFAGLSPNQPAAGDFGASTYSLGQVVNPWPDELDRADLNEAGINIARVIDGQVCLMGARTAADPVNDPAGIRLGSARLRQAVNYLVAYRLRRTNFAELDRYGVLLGILRGGIEIDVNRFAGSLYKLEVNVQVLGPDDDDTIADGETVIDVDVLMQVAPDAERIRANIRREITDLAAINNAAEVQ